MEASAKTDLFTEFHKHAAGPYDPNLRYKGPEDIAVRQKDWLLPSGNTHFEPGPKIEEALHHGPRYIDTELAEQLLEELRTLKDETLERWTTVHLAATEVLSTGHRVTPQDVIRHIESVPEWRPKLSRQAFTPAEIAHTLEGLRKLRLLRFEETSP